MVADNAWVVVCRGLMAFQAARASIFSTVSKVCGSSPGPGTLCTFVPLSMVAQPGAPCASSSVKARYVLAATPGSSS